jgi:GNAT superfamily N-acetyltransferase
MRKSIRVATAADIPKLRGLIELSVRKLQAEDYTQSQIDNALKTVFGVDSQLIADGTYFVVEAQASEAAAANRSTFAGCGGWSKHATLYGGDQWAGREDALLDPQRDAAKIRAFFVHPDWARQGIASIILDACESAARQAGFTRCEMGATLTGVKFFSARGYKAVKEIQVPVGNGEMLPVVQMEKLL